MKSFYTLLAAIAIAGITLAIAKVTKQENHQYVQVIVGAMLAVIFVFFFRFLSRMKD